LLATRVMGTAPDMDVDMEALRKKYSRPREELVAEAQAKYGPGGMGGGNAKDQTAKLTTEVIMCAMCQAHGVIKKQYGARVIDEVCSHCDGEGCFVKGQKKASQDLKDKVREVEALIADCEDLDQLERLDEALKARTIPALDAVLKEYRLARLDAAEKAREAAAAAAAADVPPAEAVPLE